MSVKNPKQTVKEIISLVGKPTAERLLIKQDVSPSTAGKLVRGTYQYEVGALIAGAIEKARKAAEQIQDSA